jgi:hypothetical protein
MLEVEVNPADVVAIPVDYNNAKMRVCKYKVLGVVTTPFDPSTALRVVSPDYVPSSDFGDEDDEDSCEYCGEEVYDDDRLCSECRYDEEEDEEDDEVVTDRYPYEDEIEGE